MGGGGMFLWIEFFWPGQVQSTAVSSGKVAAANVDWYPIYLRRVLMWATVAILPLVAGRRWLVTMPIYILWALVITAWVLVVLVYAGWYYIP